MNIVAVSGNLTKDIAIKKTESGKSVVTNTVAVRRDEKTTDFINFVVWEASAEYLSKYAKKGDKVIINGEWQTRTYESNGRTNYVNELKVNRIELVKGKEEVKEQEAESDADYTVTDDDLPF